MAISDEAAKHALNKELYNALMEGEGNKVIQRCSEIPEGPFHILTIQNDTVLHMAIYSKRIDLILSLLKKLPQDHIHKLKHQNEIGNTILHEAATSDRMVPAAMELLAKAPDLLEKPNSREETALFRAARYGKKIMFEFLDGEVNQRIIEEKFKQEEFHIRKDNTTILHISILTEHFDLAYLIATKHEYLVGKKDGDGMTALQLLACNPSAFATGSKPKSFRRLLYSCVSTEDTTETEVKTTCRVPLWEKIQEQKQRYESAVKLANFLINRDTSWQQTESALDLSKPKYHKYGKLPQDQKETEGQKEETNAEASKVKIAETPLFLATKAGITEIVEKIVEIYPQAIEYVDGEGRNILHVAIKYRQIQIFDFVVDRMEVPMIRLVRKITKNGNSILHMVGEKAEGQETEDMRSPALRLQEDLLLFERVKKISTLHFNKHINDNQKTAEKLFFENNAQLRSDAKEWIRRTAENCSIVAVLIATVAFAAAYTVPGGPNQNTGYPILANRPFFIIFTMTDVLSVAFALTSVIIFLSILSSSFRFDDFKRSLPQKIMFGITLLILSVAMMMLAFGATIILMIQNREKWTKIALSCAALLPVAIFALAYLPLYISLLKTFKHSLKYLGVAFPRFRSSPSLVSNPNSQSRVPIGSNVTSVDASSSRNSTTTQYQV